MRGAIIPAHEELSSHTWTRLPADLVCLILEHAANLNPLLALAISLLSKHVYAAIRVSGSLYRSVVIRGRTSLERYAQAIRNDTVRAKGLRNLYICNRVDYEDVEERTQGILMNEGGLLATVSASERSDANLRNIFRCCTYLEYLHIWEPFNLGYPPEMSSIDHLASYPLELLHQVFAEKCNSSLTAEAGSIDFSVFSGIQLQELTISSLATKPSDFDRTAHCQRIGNRNEPGSALDYLTSLHLHWPTLRDTPDDLIMVVSYIRSAQALRFFSKNTSTEADSSSIDPIVFANARNRDAPPSKSHSSPTTGADMPSLIAGATDPYLVLSHATRSSQPRNATLLDSLLTLNSLEQVRLTRPSPTGLVSGTIVLLQKMPRLKMLIIELGWYIDDATLAALVQLERQYDSASKMFMHRLGGEELLPPPKLVILGKGRGHKRWNGGWLQWDDTLALLEFKSRIGIGTATLEHGDRKML
ncbi:hypothetical protein K437DRAFT_274492 [Tilletiaria anomala UBC 951]|uniref:Uncharacterized protein n=1 Tax=Tilletiaria anomala (strain ATCC 24038 / CBS 436.72 / UBC 951) TaxID=1037660 RepID=A0A066VTA9_TILAU|nr:uncharacterized protein K437DRAFT_274492 [Tilletiaria anomala UBC 951]KDN44706.1 hypothetical protein K437DRAFT_274492 [Tilletiaria anomala UBC 951]